MSVFGADAEKTKSQMHARFRRSLGGEEICASGACTNHQSKRPEEREFCLRLAVKAHWSKRELERQLSSAAFERTMLSDLKLTPAVRALPQDATGAFKDSYLVDFLDLPESHSEADLQAGLLRNLRSFLMELIDGFAFLGEKVRVQVGNRTSSWIFFSTIGTCNARWHLN